MIEVSYEESDDSFDHVLQLVWDDADTQGLSPAIPSSHREFISSKVGDWHRIKLDGKVHIFSGLGAEVNLGKLRDTAEAISVKLRDYLDGDNLLLSFPTGFPPEVYESFLIGFLSGAHVINEQAEKHFLQQKDFRFSSDPYLPSEWQKAKHIAEGRLTARRWLDRGQNQKTTPVLTESLREWAKKLGLSIRILGSELALERNLHAFLAVNQGSKHEGAFVILEHKPEKPSFSLGLVGKCITFDTGGISIKSSTNLHYMKSDMGGAAAVLGAMQVIANLGAAVHAVAILPITDNAVDQSAYHPSDVISSHAGLRIEIIDTDAEGRLTLADGLSYLIKTYQPEVVIDLATLTGSAVRTLGPIAAALFCEDEALAGQLQQAGSITNERLWPLPLWEDYRKNLDSDIADIKNYSGKPVAGAIDAAIFLKEFTHGQPKWAHLDIAGVAFGQTPFGKDKSATGYGVHLIWRLIEILLASAAKPSEAESA